MKYQNFWILRINVRNSYHSRSLSGSMVDEKDLAILKELRSDSRRSTNQIAKILGIPRATVHERIKKMIQKGLIEGFTVITDYAQLGMQVTAFVLVSFLPTSLISQRDLAQQIAALEGVFGVHLISGQHDILVKVRGESMESIGSLVIDEIRGMEGVGGTLTCVSFSTVKQDF
jgi:Lrp/AsnC family transcriptional regulator, leucine-responsive regulatory protein